jgi:hypothetical protein
MLFNLTTFNRPNCLRESLASLEAALHSVQPSDIYIADDGSDDARTRALLLAAAAASKHRFHLRSSENPHVGVNLNNFHRLDMMSSDASPERFVYLSDDDILYSASFHDQLHRLKARMEGDPSIFCGTLFDSQNARHQILDESDPEYLVKRIVGGCSMLIRIGDFLAAMRRFEAAIASNSVGWDSALAEYARERERRIICSRRSYVQHIGKWGVNSTPAMFDHAPDFVD